MPDLSSLEQFNRELIKLGNEPAIAARRGEEIEKPMSPEEYPLDNSGPAVRTNAQSQAPAKPATPSTDDFLSQLDPDMFSGSAEPENTEDSGTAPVSGSAGPTGGFDDLFPDDTAAVPESSGGDFSDLFDDDVLAGITDAQTSKSADQGAESEFDADSELPPDVAEESTSNEGLGTGGTEEESAAADDFSTPDFDFESLGDAGAEDGENEEEPAAPRVDDSDETGTAGTEEAEFETPSEGTSEFDDPFGGLDLGTGDLDFGAESDETAAAVPEDAVPAAGTGAEPGEPEDLDFGNLDFGDETADQEPQELDNADDFDLGDSGTPDFGAETPPDSAPSSEDATPPATDDFGGIPDFSTDMPGDFGTDEFSDEFNMGDFGKDFGVMEEVAEKKDAGPETPTVMEEVDEVIAKATAADEAQAFDLSDADFKRMQECLSAMPLNLKIATEEALGNADYTLENVQPLINALVRGESPKDIASIVSRVTGKKIRIPAGYERKTGLAFEQEQRSFAYQFRENILPMLRIVGLVIVALGVVAYISYQWIYRPLRGNYLYDQGIAAIHAQEYTQGNGFFDEAYRIWPDNNRYLQYAMAFRQMRAYDLATTKYQELLGMPDPRDKPYGRDRLHREGILEYADFAAYTQLKYGTAANYLQRLVNENKFDHVPVVAQGDVFLEWARYTDPDEDFTLDLGYVRNTLTGTLDPVRLKETGPADLYERARYNYASLIAKEGQTDDLLSRMLRYFMRLSQFDNDQALALSEKAENAKQSGLYSQEADLESQARSLSDKKTLLDNEVTKIKDVFVKEPNSKPNPAVTAELAGYLIDQAEGNVQFMQDAANLSLRAIRSGPEGQKEPGLHYELARYYRGLRDIKLEADALKWSKTFFDERQSLRPLDRFELTEYIDTLIRDGELRYGPAYGGNDFTGAQISFQTARDLYERAISTGLFKNRSSLFGRVYAHLGDILYYQAVDYPAALAQYNQARRNQYGLPPDEISLNSPRLTMEELAAGNQDVSYKEGFIWYKLANVRSDSDPNKDLMYDQAAKEFMRVQSSIPERNDNLDFAIANTNYFRADYDAAASMYRVLIDRLEMERQKFSTVKIEEDVHHRELVEFQIRADTNLGVSLYKLSRQGGRLSDDYLAQAQFYLSRATEIYQAISHDPLNDAQATPYGQDLKRGSPFVNLQALVQPSKADVVTIDPDLRIDLSAANFENSLHTDSGPGL